MGFLIGFHNNKHITLQNYGKDWGELLQIFLLVPPFKHKLLSSTIKILRYEVHSGFSFWFCRENLLKKEPLFWKYDKSPQSKNTETIKLLCLFYHVFGSEKASKTRFTLKFEMLHEIILC